MLQQELAELRAENARLRVDATRLRALDDGVARLHALEDPGGGRLDPVSDDARDEIWHRIAAAELARRTVMAALAELEIAAGQLLRRLELEVGPMELDRRVVDGRAPTASSERRRGAGAAGAPAEHGAFEAEPALRRAGAGR